MRKTNLVMVRYQNGFFLKTYLTLMDWLSRISKDQLRYKNLHTYFKLVRKLMKVSERRVAKIKNLADKKNPNMIKIFYCFLSHQKCFIVLVYDKHSSLVRQQKKKEKRRLTPSLHFPFSHFRKEAFIFLRISQPTTCLN